MATIAFSHPTCTWLLDWKGSGDHGEVGHGALWNPRSNICGFKGAGTPLSYKQKAEQYQFPVTNCLSSVLVSLGVRIFISSPSLIDPLMLKLTWIGAFQHVWVRFQTWKVEGYSSHSIYWWHYFLELKGPEEDSVGYQLLLALTHW